MLKLIFIVFSLILIAFTTDKEVLGYADESTHQEYLDFQPYTGNRLMVLMILGLITVLQTILKTQCLITLHLMR